MLWNLLKPMLPKKAMEKIRVLNKREALSVLDDIVGLPHLESAYGGQQAPPDFRDEATRRNYMHQVTY
jgi:hypothetical protein